jgi:hypothetical protein
MMKANSGGIVPSGAQSGEVDTGSPQDYATIKKRLTLNTSRDR